MQLRDERPGDAAARYAGVVGHGAPKINGFGHRVPTSGRKRPMPNALGVSRLSARAGLAQGSGEDYELTFGGYLLITW